MKTNDLAETYKALIQAVANKEPLAFKEIFEDIMKKKTYAYIEEIKAEMHKSLFNEDDASTMDDEVNSATGSNDGDESQSDKDIDSTTGGSD